MAKLKLTPEQRAVYAEVARQMAQLGYQGRLQRMRNEVRIEFPNLAPAKVTALAKAKYSAEMRAARKVATDNMRARRAREAKEDLR